MDPSQEGQKSNLPVVLQVFYIAALLIMSVFLGFFYYRNSLLNARLGRLELLMEKSGLAKTNAEEPVPFSWEQALRGMEEGWPVFTPQNRLTSPGVVGIAVKNEADGFVTAANLIRSTVLERDRAVLFISKNRGEEELGRALLSMESGLPPADLTGSRLEEYSSRFAGAMEKYEDGLVLFRDFNMPVDELYRNVFQLSGDYPVDMIIVEGDDVLAAENLEGLISGLRVVSLKSFLPIILIDSFNGIKPGEIPAGIPDRMTGFMEVSKGENGNSLKIKTHKFQGEAPPESLPINPGTGRITGLE